MDNPSKKPRRLWRVVLVLSLALNVAVIGAVAGLAISGRAMDGPPQRISFDFGPIGRVLEPADRRAIGHSLRTQGPKPFDRAEMREKMAGLVTALRSEPFDSEAVSREIGSFRKRSDEVQQNAQNAFVAHLASMSAEARAKLADKLENGSRR